MRITIDLGNGSTKWADLGPTVAEGLKSPDPLVVEQAKADVRKAVNILLAVL